MANHKSAIKRIRSTVKKRLLNRNQTKISRTMIKKLRGTKDKTQAQKMLLEVTSQLDKLAKKNILHKNTVSHKKSKLTHYVNSLS